MALLSFSYVMLLFFFFWPHSWATASDFRNLKTPSRRSSHFIKPWFCSGWMRMSLINSHRWVPLGACLLFLDSMWSNPRLCFGGRPLPLFLVSTSSGFTEVSVKKKHVGWVSLLRCATRMWWTKLQKLTDDGVKVLRVFWIRIAALGWARVYETPCRTTKRHF